MITISFSTLFRWVIAGFLIVSIGHIAGVLLTHDVPNIEKNNYILRYMFYFGNEKSISALYSAFLFLLVGHCFKTIGRMTNTFSKHWAFLQYLAIFLACDEWFAIHDALLNVYGMGPFNVPIWVWVYGLLFGTMLLIFIPFLKQIPKYLMLSILLSGTIYVSGSGIMEVVTYSYENTASLAQNIGWFIEDGLEMIGLVTMLGCLGAWLKNQGIVTLSLHRVISIATVVIGVTELTIIYILSKVIS